LENCATKWDKHRQGSSLGRGDLVILQMKMILHREGLVSDENGGDFEKGKIDTPNMHIYTCICLLT